MPWHNQTGWLSAVERPTEDGAVIVGGAWANVHRRPSAVVGFVGAIAVLLDLGDDGGALGRRMGVMRVEIVDVDPCLVGDRLVGGTFARQREQEHGDVADVQLDPRRLAAFGGDAVP